MSKRKSRSKKQKSVRPPRRKRPAAPSREWQMEDVVGILFNPVYGYGKLLLPSEVVVAHVLRLNEELAERQKSLGRALTLAELDEEFMALMDRLVAQGLCWHEQDVPSIIPKEEWLRTQQTAIQRLSEGEDILRG